MVKKRRTSPKTSLHHHFTDSKSPDPKIFRLVKILVYQLFIIFLRIFIHLLKHFIWATYLSMSTKDTSRENLGNSETSKSSDFFSKFNINFIAFLLIELLIIFYFQKRSQDGLVANGICWWSHSCLSGKALERDFVLKFLEEFCWFYSSSLKIYPLVFRSCIISNWVIRTIWGSRSVGLKFRRRKQDKFKAARRNMTNVKKLTNLQKSSSSVVISVGCRQCV